MKYREMTKLAEEVDWSGVVFFAQLLDEMLFDFTLDTYKPSALSPALLCSEALSTLEQIEEGHVERRRLEPILAELKNVISGDEACQALLEFSPTYYLQFSETESIESAKVRLSILANRLKAPVYLREVEERLAEVLTSGREKKRIRALGRAWVSALICSGMHRSYIEEHAHNFFFSPDKKILSFEDLKGFFSVSKAKPVSYEAIFFVSKIFEHVSGPCASFNCRLSSEYPRDDGSRPETWGADPNWKHLVVKGIEALDPYSAREVAEQRLGLISDLFVLYHHKERLSWKKSVLVARVDNGDSRCISPPNSALEKIADNFPSRAAERLGDLLNRIEFRDHKASSKFTSIVQLHGAAADVESPRTQLVNIWTALEVTIPPGKASKLQAVTDTLMPYLLCGYVDSLFYDLAGDIWRWRKRAAKAVKLAALPPGMKLHHKVALILLSDAYSEARDKLFEISEGYPLLRFRMFSMQERFGSRTKIRSSLARHKERLVWQIARIYRARNMIVHSGNCPSIIDVLAENAHSYLDTFIGKVLSLAMDDGRVRSVDEASMLMMERFSQWWKYLEVDEPLSVENVAYVLSAERQVQ